jgi:integrase
VDPGKRLGKRERFFYRTEVEAKTKAQELRVRLANEGRSSARLSDRERDDAAECLQRLRPLGVGIMEAVSFYLAHARPQGGERTVHEVVTEFMVAKRNAGRKESYLHVQQYVLGNVFAGEFGTRKIHEVSAPEIDAWMSAKPWTMRTRLNYFSDIRNLFGFAVRRGYRPTNPIAQIEKPTVTESSPGVLTVEQASALLNACASGEAEMLPAVAIGLFAGLRTAELEQLDWRHVDLRENNIHVPPEVAKTREGRDVEIHPTLRAWLLPLARTDGKLAPAKSYDWRLAQKAAAAGITDWPKNALRHSFASYHFAAFKNAPLTSAMLGHHSSTQTFEKRYKKRVTPSDAMKFWNLLPVREGKVVRLAA